MGNSRPAGPTCVAGRQPIMKTTRCRPPGTVAESGSATARRDRGGRILGLLTAIVVGLGLLLVVDARESLRDVLAWVARSGAWGPVLFVLAYVAATVLFFPGSILTLGAGAVFGVVRGSVYVSIGSTLGATAAFLVGRYLARDWVTARIAGNRRFVAIDQAVAREGWKIVFLARLSPVFPFNLLNYALGLTRVSLAGYVLSSWVGMMPGTVVYVYLGSLARESAVGRERSPAEWALYAIGLAATLAVTWLVARLARRALSQRSGATG